MLMASSPGARVKTGVTATPSVEARLPARGQGEGGESVGTVDLGRPDVGVAEVGDAVNHSRCSASVTPSKGIVMP